MQQRKRKSKSKYQEKEQKERKYDKNARKKIIKIGKTNYISNYSTKQMAHCHISYTTINIRLFYSKFVLSSKHSRRIIHRWHRWMRYMCERGIFRCHLIIESYIGAFVAHCIDVVGGGEDGYTFTIVCDFITFFFYFMTTYYHFYMRKGKQIQKRMMVR